MSRPRLLVVVGGIRTEPDYLSGLRDSMAARPVDIQIVTRDRSPREVVAYAAAYLARAKDEFDEVWCVYDVDQYDIESAEREASRRRFAIAVSNPCFELWLLLHFQDWTAFLEDYRAAVQRLRKHVAGYDKTDLRFADYEAGVGDAIARARKLGDEGNPSTGMWRLAMRIRNEEDDG